MPYRIINAEAYLDKQVEAGNVSREDADLINGFCEERKATKGISESTALVTAKGLTQFADMLASFKECTAEDIFKAINATRDEWSQNTRRLRVFYLKTFFQWLIRKGYNTEIDTKDLEEISIPKANKLTKTASQMIPEDKINLMIKSCKNSRDRALISFLYEGALRPIEAREATWSQVHFDEYGVVYNTAKKTGEARRIRMTTYAPYLATWRADYPGTPEGDAVVFVTNRGNPLSRQRFDDIISHAAKAAGLKGVYPYILRHSRITAMVEQEIPESVIKLQSWGHISTPMMATYTHLTGDSIDTILLGKAGIKKRGRPPGPSIKPTQCPHCSTVNLPGAHYCTMCGLALTKTAAASEAEALSTVRSQPEITDQQKQIEAMQREIRELKEAMKRG
jgi:site-specific recombinase XerD